MPRPRPVKVTLDSIDGRYLLKVVEGPILVSVILPETSLLALRGQIDILLKGK